MTNEELIAALRTCADHNAVGDKCYGECPYNGNYNECVDQMILDAADALEAAEHRIEDLEGALAACRMRKDGRIPKEGEWIWENYCWHCSVCGENPTRGMGYVQGKNDLFRVCPNCGAKMKTVTDCHTLEEENDEQIH